MKSNYQAVMKLLKAAINEEIVVDNEIAEWDWKEIYTILEKSKMLGVTFKCVKNMSDNDRPPKDIFEKWEKVAFRIGILQIENDMQMKRLNSAANEENVKLIFFKGKPISLLYPEHLMRFSCDIDVFVEKKDFDKTVVILEKNGFKYCEKTSKKCVYDYINSKGCKIELHTRLWEDYESEQTKILDSYELTTEENLEKFEVAGAVFSTLGIEEHLIFQMFHIIKHFSLEGVSVKYLTDITLYINRYCKSINWERFWKRMEELHYDKFCNIFFKIAQKYLNMRTDIPMQKKYYKIKPDDSILEDILNVGKVGEDDTQSWRIVHLMLPYYMQERKVPHSLWGRIRYLYFPSSEEISDYYMYAKKCKLLLPIAWIHRVIYRVFRDASNEDIKGQVKLKKVEHRIKMLNETGLSNK